MKPLERDGVIDLWADDEIKAGTQWKEEIQQALAGAKAAILLISGNFLASDFIAEDKGDKTRDVPIFPSLANELRLHLGERESGYVFPSRQGGHYSSRRIQQLVKEVATDAGITKNVYPHLLRHTMAQHLADQGMPENLLQRFLGHDHPATTQVYYEPARRQVKRAFQDAMGS